MSNKITLSKRDEILDRISIADECSPISVFMVNGVLTAAPTRTVITRQWLAEGTHYHIGTFTKEDKVWRIKQKIREAL